VAVDTTGDRARSGSAGDGPPSPPRTASQASQAGTRASQDDEIALRSPDIPAPHDTSFPLSVEVASHDRAVTIVIYGELDAATAPALRALLDRLLEPEPEHLVFELGGLTFADCAGARVIADAGHRISGDRKPVIRHVRPAVRRVFELLDLDAVWLIDLY
jgi:anti-anti-sigma factor